ncbi:MAG: ATP-binding protein [Nitrospirae bacterium]|nr:ATP-binding protein [Nitrospirota bacterium]
MNEAIFLITALLLLIVSFAFFLVRTISKLRKDREKARKKEESQVGFIVGTFQELVGKLKEKEKELDALRRKAEDRADVIENYNEYILQSVPSGVISFDSDFAITKVNLAAERILNLVSSDVIGKDYHDVFGEPLKGILDGKVTIERGEIQYTTPSGKDIYLGLALTPLVDATGKTIGQLMVFSDLTELKALQSQAELRDRLSSLGEMAAGMAHELRNPMAVIAGYTKLLAKKTDPSLLHVVDSVSKEVAVMDRIITDFLSFARPAEPNISRVDPGQVIRRCLAHLIAERNDIRARYALQGIPSLEGDEILLRQAFTNLIQNAVEAMPQGGELGFSFTKDAHAVEVSISDTGHGIPEKIRDKIFLPFYTTKDKGTGLGLALVHKIITSHRGSISVESNENGTTFRLRFPLATAAMRSRRATGDP